MNEPNHQSESGTGAQAGLEKEPALKRFMDNPWILLFLGVLIPILSYTIWGWIDLWAIPKTPLP